MNNKKHTLKLKGSAIDLTGSGEEYALSLIAERENKYYDDIQKEFNQINQTYKKAGKGYTITYQIQTLRDCELLEEFLGGNLGWQETQNMFGEDLANRPMEKYLDDKLAELRIIEKEIKDQEDNNWFIDTEKVS